MLMQGGVVLVLSVLKSMMAVDAMDARVCDVLTLTHTVCVTQA